MVSSVATLTHEVVE